MRRGEKEWSRVIFMKNGHLRKYKAEDPCRKLEDRLLHDQYINLWGKESRLYGQLNYKKQQLSWK
jgi:CRISPR/Cas system CSM-associated protein Csm3 (group 7 of RAMP superfamily)